MDEELNDAKCLLMNTSYCQWSSPDGIWCYCKTRSVRRNEMQIQDDIICVFQPNLFSFFTV